MTSEISEKERRAAYHRRYRAQNKEKMKAIYTRYYRVNREAKKKAVTERRRSRESAGWTEERYQQALRDQGGLCAICQKPAEGKALAADHDHIQNTPRALLCIPCNLGLGCFRDTPELLQRAAEYLRRWSSTE